MSYRNKSGFKFYSTQKALLNSEKKRFETVLNNANASCTLFLLDLKTRRAKNEDKINTLESLMREDIIDKTEQLGIFNDELKKDEEHVDSQIKMLEEKRSKSMNFFKTLMEDHYINTKDFTQADKRHYSDNFKEFDFMEQEIKNKIVILASLQENFIKEKRIMAKIISDVTDLISQETATKEAAKVKVSAAAASDLILEEEKEEKEEAARRLAEASLAEARSAEAARRLAEAALRTRQKSDDNRPTAAASTPLDLSALGRYELSSPDDISLFQLDPSTDRFELFAPNKVGSSNIVRLSDTIDNKATRKQFSAQISGMLQNELHGNKVSLVPRFQFHGQDNYIIRGNVDGGELFHITFHKKEDELGKILPEVININLDDVTKNNGKKLVLKMSFYIHQDVNGSKTFIFKHRWIVKIPIFNEADETTSYIIDPNEDISSQDENAVQMLINISEFIKSMFIQIFQDKLETDPRGGRKTKKQRKTRRHRKTKKQRKTRRHRKN